MTKIENGNEIIFYGGDLNVPPCEKNIGQYLLEKMANIPNKIAQIDPISKKTQTYEELRISSIRCALKMKREDGVRRGDIVMICGRNHFDLFTPVLGAMYLGATINPLHPDYSPKEILRMIRITEPKIIFCDSDCTKVMIDTVNEVKLKIKVVTFETDFKSYLAPHSKAEEDSFVAETVDVLNDNLFILCTSGTTGFIKGVTITHNAYYLSLHIHRLIRENEGPILCYSPLSWISAILFCGLALWHGQSKITCEYDPELNLEILKNYKIKWVFFSPLKIMEMLRHPKFLQYEQTIIENLQYMCVGGSGMTFQQLKECRETFRDTFVHFAYGSTEMMIFPAIFDRDTQQNLNFTKVTSSGQPMVSTYWKLVDPETGKNVGRNQEGELWVKSPVLTKGYYKDPESTAQAIDKNGWFHTGDIVTVDEDNCLHTVGRSKELLKYKGWQVAPNEIENILCSHPAVDSACVMGKPHETEGDLPLAFVVKKKTAKNVIVDEIINFVNGQVVDYQKLRGGVIFLDELPRTANGKVRRIDLKKMIQ